jgi:DNA-binding SARP family transcriptional activator/tetratricopeptide (TPR) repeat protein
VTEAVKVHVRLLGSIDVMVDGATRPVPGLRRKAVLAVLGLRAGEVVSTDSLVDIVWGDKAPATALNTLQRHASYLRRVLGDGAALVARGRGYLLDLPGEATDVHAAEKLIRQGQQAVDPEQRVSRLRSALALWRGEALVDVCDLTWLDEQARRLARLRHSAVRALIEARLTLGEHAHLVPELQHLAEQHPFDEDIHRQLVLALHRAGRQTDALATFQRLRRSLRDDLGVDPSPAMRALEVAILRHDPGLDPPAAPVTVLPAPVELTHRPVPRQLPAAAPHFVGRTDELAELCRLADQGSSAVLVTGMAGVGKTSLAVAWAHQMAPQFPDGQLYVNLRGFDPSRSAMTPDEALRGLLDGLGVPERTIPPGFEAQVGLYRSLLSERRVLLVLDDARDADQVRAILPGSPTCRTIVTSRLELAGLVAVDGAHPVALAVLSDVEARQMLAHRLGAKRVSAEPEATDRLIALCGRLPLAIAIVAARAASRPGFALSAIADEALWGPRAIRTGEASVDLWTVFSWSYRALSPSAARLFRLLGLHAGPDIGRPTVTSLADLDGSEAAPLLAELTDAHLITEPSPGRFGLHDMLRAYAIDLADAADTAHERDSARRRYLDHYVHTSHLGARLLDPQLPPIAVDPADPDVRVEKLNDREDALRWFTAERAALLAAVEFAGTNGWERKSWQLASSVAEFLFLRGRFDDWIVAQCRAVAAGRAATDPAILPRMLYLLSTAYWYAGRYDDAYLPSREALDLFRDLGDVGWQARTENLLGALMDGLGRRGEALAHARRSLALFEQAGDVTGQASTHNSIAMCHARLGDHQQAIDHCHQALDHYRSSNNRIGQAATWDTLGYAHHGAQQYGEALRCFHCALHLARDLGDRYNEAGVFTRIGDTHRAAGNHPDAVQAWRQALAIYDDLGHPDGAEVRARLDGADRS